VLEGLPLYPPTDPDAGNLYRYAPWFAFAWTPFALLGDAGILVWRLVVLGSALYVIGSVLAIRTHAAYVMATLAIPLLGAPVLGNVEAPLLAMLVWRRSDPWSVGIAASLKLYPLLLCAGYVAERRWKDVAIAVGVTLVLWAPAPLLGLQHYVTDPGFANGNTGGWLWDMGIWIPVTGLLVAGIVCLAWRRSRWAWLAASLALPWSVPRYTGNELAYLWPALRRLR
jgi:hypothetical protein